MAAQLGIGRQTLIALESGAEGASAGMVLRILTDLGVTIVALPAAAGDPESAPEPGVISP
jgi:transcriptional regulator with XRE-family HTH domain